MMQTLALFRNAYRELNAKKLFWITMILSGLVVAAFAAVGISSTGMTVLVWDIPIPGLNTETMSEEMFYKQMFVGLGLGVWLTWIATVLALVSTSSMFAEFVSSGSIDLLLAKPISRVRLYLTEYFAGLLFVALQVSVFTVASFLVIGVRGGAWEPGLFLAIPIVLLFFSYLFCVCALIGLLTRSGIAALLLTILFWFFLFMLNAADQTFVMLRERAELVVSKREAQIESMYANAVRMAERGDVVIEGFDPETDDASLLTEDQLREANWPIANREDQLERERESLASMNVWANRFYWAKTVFPKTSETVELLNRVLVSQADLENYFANQPEQIMPGGEDDIEINQIELTERTQMVIRGRSVWWVMGTSVLFELVILGVGVLIFSRRDF